jgi:hypothetical protein
LRIFLLLIIGAVGMKIYWIWKEAPWDLPGPARVKSNEPVQKPPVADKTPPPSDTEIIVGKNLFDPERGAGKTREVETASNSLQRIRDMVLLGTAIIGNERFAVVQDGANAPAAAAKPGVPMRIKIGEMIEGFRLSEIGGDKVVFTKGPTRVEVKLDYFRQPDLRPPRVAAREQPQTPPASVPRNPPPRVQQKRLPTPQEEGSERSGN